MPLDPPALSPFELMVHHGIGSEIDEASSEDDYYQILYQLEASSPLSGAAAECPYFVLMPPSLAYRDEWGDLLEPSQLERSLIESLVSNGFMPLSRSLYRKKTLSDFFEGLGLELSHTLIDLDYGIMLRPHGSVVGNFSFDRGLLDRLQAVDPYFSESPASVLSIGAIRSHHVMYRKLPEVPEVLEFEISSREALNRILDQIINGIGVMPVQVWYRGQTRDYLLPDLRDHETVCPWRNLIDSSMVPSLYRQAWDGTSELREYCSMLHTLQEYVYFMKGRLGMKPFTDRVSSEVAIEKLSPAWGAYTGGPSVTQTDQDGNVLARRDYHPAFAGMQQAFFLQHYGLPSNILDITSSVDVALFFAQNEVSTKQVFEPVDHAQRQPILYIFFLLPGMDRFIDSRSLAEHYHLERPLRQKCGLLCGASFITRNYYSRFIGVKLHLRNRISYDPKYSAEYLFPDRSADPFLDSIVKFQEERGLTRLGPFVLDSK